MSSAAPRSVLVVVTRQIGDVLLTTPLIHRARELWPQARIDVLGFEGTLGMLRGNADLDELIGTGKRLGWRGTADLARRLWRRYDLALVAEASDRAHLIALLAARRRRGLLRRGHGSNWWKRLTLEHAVFSSGDTGSEHVVTEKLRLLEPWHLAADERVVPPPPGALPPDVASALRPDAVVIHAPSMWPYKQWPPENVRAVAAELLARGHQVVLTGTAAARDQECIAPLRDLAPAPRLLDLSGRLGGPVAAVLARAALYIGARHLRVAPGAGVGGCRPSSCSGGRPNPQRWAPWPAAGEAPVSFQRRAPAQTSGNVTLVQAPLPCVPCSRAGCEDHNASRSDCLQRIGPSEVLAQATILLQRKPPQA